MTKFKKYQNSIEAFLHSDNGQRFFNIAYSVGAAIVIWGALFKILHLPGGNTLLCVGMGTEIAMFLLTAFDRPPKEPNWDEIVPALRGEKPMAEGEELTIDDDVDAQGGSFHSGNIVIQGGTPGMSGVIVAGGGGGVAPIDAEAMDKAAEELKQVSDLAEATNRFVDAIEGISKQMSELKEAMTDGSSGYVDKMADLNRNLAGLNTIYEIQLRSVSGQLDAIERVNKGLKDIRDMYERSALDSARYCEESEKMTRQMQQINEVYAKMIAALSIPRPTV